MYIVCEICNATIHLSSYKGWYAVETIRVHINFQVASIMNVA